MTARSGDALSHVYFQARLVLHEQGEALLKKSIDEARRKSRLNSKGLDR